MLLLVLHMVKNQWVLFRGVKKALGHGGTGGTLVWVIEGRLGRMRAGVKKGGVALSCNNAFQNCSWIQNFLDTRCNQKIFYFYLAFTNL